MTISCKKASELISKRMERTLTILEWLQLRYHLSICDGCTFWQQQVAALRKLLKNRSDASKKSSTNNTPSLSADARERIKASLKE